MGQLPAHKAAFPLTTKPNEPEYPPSLDSNVDDNQESHYIGSGAFLDSVLTAGFRLDDDPLNAPFSSTRTGPSADPPGYRQVSRDPYRPAFFVTIKPFMFGKGPTEAEGVYSGIRSLLGPVQVDKLVES